MDAVVVMSLGLVGLALLIILYPLWRQTQAETLLEVDSTRETLEELQVRYEASLAAIKDLMFDYEMGKVSTEDYEALLSRTKLEAAQLRRQIDQLSVAAAEVTPVNAALDTEIEESVAQLRRQQEGSQELLAEVEAEIESLKEVQPGLPASSTCPGCGRTLRPDDAFCSGCGRAVTPEELPPLEENCPNCGYTYQPGDAFCARCGAVLQTAVAPDYEDSKL